MARISRKNQNKSNQSGFVGHDIRIHQVVYFFSFILCCFHFSFLIFSNRVVKKGFFFLLLFFLQAFPKDIKSYDPNDSAWPGKLDEFAEVRKKRIAND
jgi:hypothetical protein